jgi:hypothetical protein
MLEDAAYERQLPQHGRGEHQRPQDPAWAKLALPEVPIPMLRPRPAELEEERAAALELEEERAGALIYAHYSPAFPPPEVRMCESCESDE